MKPAPMSFGSYVWLRNPETVKVEYARKTACFPVPGGTELVQETGGAPRRVSGGGRFTGSGCAEEFARLSSLFSAGGSGTLSLPGIKPFPAVFASLVQKGIPKPDCVEYEFSFLEDGSPAAGGSGEAEVYVCTGGESLWDVANRFGAEAGALLTANPQIEWPNLLEAGERVVIA